MKTVKEKALEIAQIMKDLKGENVTVLDVSRLNSWTDFFIIVTVNSSTHSSGLRKEIKDYVKENEDIDESNIFLVGLSGGGHMALLMAGLIPEYFRGIAAFVPISDLAKWHEENPSYAPHIDHCTGGDVEEMLKRSPISYIDTAARGNIKIFHGKFDSCVPVRQSIEFYTKLTEKYPTSRVFLDIFDGGHQFVPNLFKTWLNAQYKETETKIVTG